VRLGGRGGGSGGSSVRGDIHFETVFFKKIGDLCVFIGDRELRQIAQHRRPDLILKLGGSFHLLLLCLELLLLGLNSELMRLDFILLLEQSAFGALVGPSSDEEPETKKQRKAAGCCG